MNIEELNEKLSGSDRKLPLVIHTASDGTEEIYDVKIMPIAGKEVARLQLMKRNRK